MNIVQLSVFVENRSGRLADIVGFMADAKINIRALSLADTTDFGVLRMIVDEPEKAIEALKKKSLTIKTTEVIAAKVEDVPGGLAKVLSVFKKEHINIEYMYAFVEKKESSAALVFRVDNPDEAVKKLKGVKVLKAEDVYNI
jgi:hypothetical protein